jgi:VWFA-related protein
MSLLTAGACCAALTLPTVAQQAAATPQTTLQTHAQQQAAIAARAKAQAAALAVVHLNIAVEPKSSSAKAPDLNQADFTITEDKKPVTLTNFQRMHTGDEPVRIVIALDTSNIQADYVAPMREKLNLFLHAKDGVLPYDTAIAFIGGRSGIVISPFSKNGNELADSLKKQPTGTPHADGSAGDDSSGGGGNRGGHGGGSQRSLMGLQKLMMDAENFQGRTVVLWLSQGWPLLYGPELQLTPQQREGLLKEAVAFTTELRLANVTLYVEDPVDPDKFQSETAQYVGYLKGPAKGSDAAPAFLGIQVLAVHSGGWVRVTSDITHTMDDVYADLATYYKVSFPATATTSPDALHALSVKVNQKNLTPHTVDQYYAEPGTAQ